MSYIITRSGRHFSFTDITSADLRVSDIATALSNTCRFAGHLRDFYSVAQHSVLCSEIVAPEFAFKALMHEAAEAYIGDVTAPLKALLPDYRAIEERVDRMIRKTYGLPQTQSREVKKADLIMLATERRDFGLDDGTPWPILEGIEPASIVIEPLLPHEARELFLDRYSALVWTHSAGTGV